MEEIIILVQKSYGLLGVFVVLPLVALVVVWRQNVRLQNSVVSAHEAVTDAQKARVKDTQDVNIKLIEVLQEQTGLNTETNLALERIGEAMNEVHRMLSQNRRP